MREAANNVSNKIKGKVKIIITAVIYEFNLLHGELFYFSESPVDSNVEDVKPVSSGMVFVDVIFWIIYNREEKSESVGRSEFTLEEKGICSCGSGWLFSNVFFSDVQHSIDHS